MSEDDEAEKAQTNAELTERYNRTFPPVDIEAKSLAAIPRQWLLNIAGQTFEPMAKPESQADIKIGDGEIAGGNIRVNYPESSVVDPTNIAAQYAEASGVPGWTAKVVENGTSIDIYAPPGYTIVYSEDHTWCLRKIDWSKYGISVRKVAE